MKTLQLLDKGNIQTLLTVATDRITIKFKEGLPLDEKLRAQGFLSKVADALADEKFTYRGTLQISEDRIYIRMKSGPYSKTFNEKDFA